MKLQIKLLFSVIFFGTVEYGAFAADPSNPDFGSSTRRSNSSSLSFPDSSYTVSEGGPSGVKKAIKQKKYKEKKSLFSRGRKIAAKPAVVSSIGLPREFSVQDEDADGSRKWVQFFEQMPAVEEGAPLTIPESHQWHSKMKEVVASLKRKYPAQKPPNIAIAKLTHVHSDDVKTEIDMPYFFLSSLPARANRDTVRDFSRKLSNEQSPNLADYSYYSLSFVGYIFSGGEEREVQSFNNFKENTKQIINNAVNADSSLVQKERLQQHFPTISTSLAKRYFHSEQALRDVVKVAISEHKTKNSEVSGHFILDVCSYYDVCCCCGDTLASASHNGYFGADVYIRATGVKPYPSHAKGLRQSRESFQGYTQGQSYSMRQDGDDNSYLPFIAHAVASDFQGGAL